MSNIENKPFIRRENLFLATSPFSDYKDLTNVLKSENFIGEIHIDCLLKTGLNSRRFIQVSFNGTEFVKKSVKTSTKPSELFQFTKFVLKHSSELLENSILSRRDVEKIKGMN